MIKSYITAAWRNVVRHKLFAGINIIGLAISMSVGLLIVSFVSNLLSYDDFHRTADRTYRVVTTRTATGSDKTDYASSSIKISSLIRQSIVGLEQVTNLSNGSGGEFSVGERSVAIGTMYADNSFLKVFDFPLLEGDRATALAQPQSLVLTEQAKKRLFGDEAAIGKAARFNNIEYIITGVLRALPQSTHFRFEGLVSLATAEVERRPDFNDWTNVYATYTYIVLNKETDPLDVQHRLDQLSNSENDLSGSEAKFSLSLQPLMRIAFGRKMTNEIGPILPSSAVWVLIGLALVVLISSCFNYTSLSIARAMKRSREIGIRKISGAAQTQVVGQFLIESVIIAMAALVVAFVLFLFVRPHFLSLHSFLNSIVTLELSPTTILYFIVLGISVGLVAGVLPALMFSRTNIAEGLKGTSVAGRSQSISLRKVIVVVQYVFSFAFITSTAIGYTQYRNFLSCDLGYKTENILNIRLQGNNPEIVKAALMKLSEVSEVSQSKIVVGLGNTYSEFVKRNSTDSVLTWINVVDEKYLALHEFDVVQGRNFIARSQSKKDNEAIVTELFLKHFGINPSIALGETFRVNEKEATIIGVVKDFHYETLEDNVQPVVFLYDHRLADGVLNAKISSPDVADVIVKVERAWKEIDKVHALSANWYDDQIAESYSMYLMMIKVVGFSSILAICIASLGLLGMVVFTTETRLRELSIRKVLGAGVCNVIWLLSRSFIILLSIAGLISLPATYLFFDSVVLSNVAYHVPIGVPELFAAGGIVSVIAVIIVGSQALAASRKNPALILRTE